MIGVLLGAAGFGLLTAVSPCPLATNIAALSYIGRHAGSPRRSLMSGVAYVVGRTLCYTLLAAAIVEGLLVAATASGVLGRLIGMLVGPLLMVAGAMILDWLPAPTFGAASGRMSEKLAERGDAVGAFLLGVVFALSFCPASAAIFFGSLVPLATLAESSILVPATYGVATGAPVLVFAVLIAAGGHGLGRAFDRIKAVERWLRVLAGLVLIGVGIYLCLRTNWGLLAS